MYLKQLSDLGNVHLPVLIAGAVPLLLLVGFVVLATWGRKMRGGGWLAVILSGLAALMGAFVAMAVMGEDNEFLPWHAGFEWLQVGGVSIHIGIRVDHKSGVMLAMVTGISLLVHIFSLAYIAKDEMRHRYWGYLALFSAAMCGLVLADNLLIMFIFWELVGLSSYLLIGFWFKEKLPAMASQKAFIVNRIADAGFVMALIVMFWRYGHFFPEVMNTVTPQLADYLICIGLIVAAVGKSAQFPFQVWLPDAMAGPTPVSSLIHAATMVVAGVYMLIRVAPELPPPILDWIAFLGAITALAAAVSALTQTDIKRVLAYSTVSQLGFMMLGIGVREWNFALFHLLTHAFFKCGLFLVAGAVIHNLHAAQEKAHAHFDAQDMRLMGGLRRQMPLAFACWLFFAASLAGLPLFSGFMSKDGILLGAVNFAEGRGGGWAWTVPIAGIATSLLTAFYITRQGILVFLGRNRAQGTGAKADFLATFPKTSWKMLLPLLVLALGSTWVIFSPANPFHPDLLKPPLHARPLLPWIFVGIAVVGVLAAAIVFRNGPLAGRSGGFVFNLSFKHFFLDAIYLRILVKPFLTLTKLLALVDHHVVDGAVRLVAGAVLRRRAPEGEPQEQIRAATDRPSLSWASNWVDRNLIDRLVNGVATLVQRGGKQAAHLQSGRVQLYILYSLLALLLLLLVLMFIFTA